MSSLGTATVAFAIGRRSGTGEHATLKLGMRLEPRRSDKYYERDEERIL